MNLAYTSDLTHTELTTILECLNQSLVVRTGQELQNLLVGFQAIIPYEQVLASLGKKHPTEGYVTITPPVATGFPDGWLEHYQKNGYENVDPMLQFHFSQFQTRIWTMSDVRKMVVQNERVFIDHVNSLDISQKITLGVSCSRHHMGGSFFYFATRSPGDAKRHATILNSVIPHFHIALMRIAFPIAMNAPELSGRELEVLEWMKEGKSNWVISQILIISERTVKFHVQNILSKLGASTRCHAVALALNFGIVSF